MSAQNININHTFFTAKMSNTLSSNSGKDAHVMEAGYFFTLIINLLSKMTPVHWHNNFTGNLIMIFCSVFQSTVALEVKTRHLPNTTIFHKHKTTFHKTMTALLLNSICHHISMIGRFVSADQLIQIQFNTECSTSPLERSSCRKFSC